MLDNGQRGEGRTGFIVTLVIVVALFFVGFKVIPVRISAYQLDDTLRDEVRFASANRNDDRAIKKRILEEAESLDIPLAPENLTIKRTKKEVVIRARYEQPIDFKITTYTYRFDKQQAAPVF